MSWALACLLLCNWPDTLTTLWLPVLRLSDGDNDLGLWAYGRVDRFGFTAGLDLSPSISRQ
jgi:hypothetical protein